ncbi:MAG TPA: hypothetical protein VFU22_02670 [Roseiflexaceae bacterium]|nr:hypothetical protein [Roseiflexaceae bacterium]
MTHATHPLAFLFPGFLVSEGERKVDKLIAASLATTGMAASAVFGKRAFLHHYFLPQSSATVATWMRI